MRKLNTEKRAAILAALVEGNSINSVCRMLGVSKVTVLWLQGQSQERAVEAAFQGEVDYAMLIKIYGADTTEAKEKRYSPAVCTGCKQQNKAGQGLDSK